MLGAYGWTIIAWIILLFLIIFVIRILRKDDWMKITGIVLGTILIMLLMIFFRVKSQAAYEFNRAERYYEYYKNPDKKKQEMADQLKNKKMEKEEFGREMQEYYYRNPDKVKADLDDLLSKGVINKEAYDYLIKELSDIKEIFDSNIKTAYYGYKTVLDIWLAPPGNPPSILRNSALADKTRGKLEEVKPLFDKWLNDEGASSGKTTKPEKTDKKADKKTDNKKSK